MAYIRYMNGLVIRHEDPDTHPGQLFPSTTPHPEHFHREMPPKEKFSQTYSGHVAVKNYPTPENFPPNNPEHFPGHSPPQIISFTFPG